MPFRFQGCKLHLTYPTFIPLQDWKDKFGRFGDGFKHLSFVHELGDSKEMIQETAEPDVPLPLDEDGVVQGEDGYKHTHIAVWFKKNLDTTNPQLFNFSDEIKVNVQYNKGLKWFKHICLKYHKGHKVSRKDGKKYFKPPVYLYQEHCEEWMINENWERIIMDAPTVIAAAKELEIMAGSLGEIKNTKEGVYSKRYRVQVNEEIDNRGQPKPLPVEWNRNKKSLVLKGKAEIGKTQWALMQFEKPYKITQFDQIRTIPDDCDGVVFDDMFSYTHKLSKSNMINITSPFCDCDVRLRHNNATMPAIPRIFTCQQYEAPFGNPVDEGVARRLLVVDCDEAFGSQMWIPSAAAVVAAPPPNASV